RRRHGRAAVRARDGRGWLHPAAVRGVGLNRPRPGYALRGQPRVSSGTVSPATYARELPAAYTWTPPAPKTLHWSSTPNRAVCSSIPTTVIPAGAAATSVSTQSERL